MLRPPGLLCVAVRPGGSLVLTGFGRRGVGRATTSDSEEENPPELALEVVDAKWKEGLSSVIVAAASTVRQWGCSVAGPAPRSSSRER